MLPFHAVRPRALSMRLLQALSLSVALGTATTIMAAPPSSGADAGTHAFHISAGSLAEALHQFIAQSGLQVLYDPALVEGRVVARIDSVSTSRAALDTLLRNTGLTYEFTDSGTVVIKRAASVAKPQSTQAQKQSVVEKGAPPTTLETVAVTGTRIRGGITASPTITIDAQQIQNEGFSDLGEVIRSVPQNFAGGQNPGIVSGATAGGLANQNISGGSALNLRGLGPDATLTLLNGQRFAYNGYVQAVDIDAIPVEAVDRIDIVPDGASAIYGSDAVGGVANVILKRDFNGVTVGTRYGGATEGGLITRNYNATAGTRWSTGGLIATWMKTSTDPIYSNQRDYSDQLFNPTTLYPDSDLRSGLLSMHQSLGDFAELRLDALRTERDQLTYYPATSTSFTPATAQDTISLASPSIEFSLPNDWTLSVGGTWGMDDTISGLSLGSTTTGVVTPFARVLYQNKSLSYEVGGEGPLFVLPGGNARLAVGAGYKENEFVYRNLTSGATSADGDESDRYAYAEIDLPLVGMRQDVPGVRQLTLTAALRGEDYDSFARVTTPKVGLIYDPSNDFTLKASWGKSFKAPTLLQRYQAQTVYLYQAAQVGGVGFASDATVLVPSGGNPELEPERARTWSTSVEFHPEALPELTAELGWFDIGYNNRIAQPLITTTEALSNPAYARFIEYSPTIAEQTDIIGNYAFYNFSGTAYDPSKVVAIAFNRYINTVAQRIKGLDLSGAYRLDLGTGLLTIRGGASWLDSSQLTTTEDNYFDQSGTLFYPAKVKARIGAVWTQGGFSASTFANYISGVTNVVDGRKGASFTTFDATLRYDTGERDSHWSGLEFALSMINLFNRAPPLYTPTTLGNPPYDSTNYSPIGRFLSVSVSKHW